MPEPISLRAYAAHRKAAGLSGGSLRAVQVAIAAGRVTADADGKIADAAQADAQWAATTRADRVPRTRCTTTRLTAPAAPAQPSRLQLLREEREALAVERERFEFDKLRGKYMLVDEVRRQIVTDYTVCRNWLLGVPSKLGQRLSRDVALLVCPIVDELIRESLIQLADGIAQARAALERDAAAAGPSAA